MKTFLRISRTFFKAADKTVGVIDHVETKARRFAILAAALIFSLIAGVILVISGMVGLLV